MNISPAYHQHLRFLTETLARVLEVDAQDLDAHRSFHAYGFTSITAGLLIAELEQHAGRRLSPTLAWDYPSLHALATYLAEGATQVTAPVSAARETSEPIALVGMACRFPGAPNLESYWQLLQGPHSGISTVPPERWAPESSDRGSRFGGFLPNIDAFDSYHFGIPPAEAAQMDPQQRLLLETSWAALENAGIAPETLKRTATGVFVGLSSNDYGRLQGPGTHTAGEYAVTGNAVSIAANRLSFFYDWTGPSLTLDTACSSSLVALHLAAQSIRRGECAQALVAGVNVILDPAITRSFDRSGLLAPDGQCKAFTDQADGYPRSEGVGCVLLKPLSAARQDGNPIYAVVGGSAVNQDGRSNGLTAPNQFSQMEVIQTALAQAGWRPTQVQYVEAHGSGTRLGDQIEANALNQTYGPSRLEPLLVGSVKTRIGHTESAAGIAGVIKLALMLRHRMLLPNLHASAARLSEDAKGLQVAATLKTWDTSETRRGGISSFGIGGTNAHVLLEEAPCVTTNVRPDADGEWVVPLTATTPAALNVQKDLLAKYLENTSASLPAVVRRLQRRARLPVRQAWVAKDLAALQEALRAERPSVPRLPADVTTVFLFSGVGDAAQPFWQGLYAQDLPFRRAVEQCRTILLSLTGYAWTFEDLDREDPVASHLSLFILQYALAEALRARGVEAQALAGHSLGEYLAATYAGVFTLEEALRLVYLRAAAIARLPAGAMLSVFLPELELREFIAQDPQAADLAVAAVNGPTFGTVSGTPMAVEGLAARLLTSGIACRTLPTTHPFHSHHLKPIQGEFWEAFENSSPRVPQIPFISSQTGTWITPEQATSVHYWWNQTLSTVRFLDGIHSLLDRHAQLCFVDLSSGQTLESFVRQILQRAPRKAGHPIVAAGQTSLATVVAKLWESGATIRWPAATVADDPKLDFFPTYAFTPERHWHQAPAVSTAIPPFWTPAWKVTARAESQSLRHVAVLTDLASDFRSAFPVDCRITVIRSEENLMERLAELPDVDGALYLHTWETPETFDVNDPLHARLTEILRLVRRPFRLGVAVAGGISLLDSGGAQPALAMLAGWVKVAAQEYPHISTLLIDAPATTPVSRLAAELGQTNRDRCVVLRSGLRLVEAYEPLTISADPAEADSGLGQVYVVLGGQGHLAQRSRNFLQARFPQATILSLSRRSQPALDLADKESTRRALGQVLGTYGRIDGIIQAAGTVRPESFLPLSSGMAGTLAPHRGTKLQGLGHLEEVIHELGVQPRWVILLSSISSVLGGQNLGGYAMAHLFMDAYAAQATHRTGYPWRLLNWDAGRTEADFNLALQTLTAMHAPAQIIASHRDLRSPSAWSALADQAKSESLDSKPRPSHLSAAYAEPATEIQKFLTHTLGQLLGVDGVGLDDSFFELGGNSLVGLQILNRIRERYAVNPPLTAFFESPRIRTLADLVEAALLAQVEAMSDEEVNRLLEETQHGN